MGQQGGSQRVSILEHEVVCELALDRADRRLRGRVVPAVVLAAHVADHAVRAEPRAEGVGGAGRAAIGGCRVRSLPAPS